jgi:subfamily B ATP-binding cassette protein MsbA
LNDVVRAAPSTAPDGVQTYRRLLSYLRPHWGTFVLGILGAILFSLTQVSMALLVKLLADGTFTHRDPRVIVWIPAALVGLFAARGLGDFTQTYFMGHVSRHIVKRLRQQMFERVVRLPMSYFDRNSSATLLSRLTFNVEMIGQAATDSVVTLVRESLTIVGSVALLLWLNTRLTLIALAIAPLIAWLMRIINHHFRRYSRRIQDSVGDVTRVAKESFDAPRLIKVYNAEPHLSAQFEAVNEHNRRSNMRLILTKGLANPVIQLIAATGGAVVLWIAIADAIHGRMTMGDLLAFLAALVNVAQPLRNLIGVAGPLQQGVAAAQSLFELIDEPAESEGHGFIAQRVRGEVDFQEVSFAYKGGKQAALRNVSLSVPAGQSIAIVGRSGSGKSTLVSLLPRFYEADSGRVRIDGRNVREYELRSLREQIAVVSQEVVLFNDSIRNNIAFGRDVSRGAVERAAEAAYAMEFIATQPQGLDTLVGDRGVLLSGGQRQRIAIARALLKDAPILILDEATSALDTEAERQIRAAIGELVRNRTTFVIAHRLSTVEQADRIIVLDAGAIVEDGTHAELLGRGGLYAQLHRLQFSD